MLAFCGSPLSKNIALLKNGQLLCRGVPLARSGAQQYSPSELGLDLPQRSVTVMRPEEEVFAAASMASFEGAVITDQHPPSFVQPGSFKAYSCGHVQNVREGSRTPNGDRVLVGDLVIGDANLIDKVRSGAAREISAGYDCQYFVSEDGSVSQRGIRCNHVAVVPQSRAGNTKIYDSNFEGSTMSQPEITELIDALNKIAAAFSTTNPQPVLDHEAACAAVASANFQRRLAIEMTDGCSDEARAFADAANALGRKLRSRGDCRPALTEYARALDASADDFAQRARQFHRK